MVWERDYYISFHFCKLCATFGGFKSRALHNIVAHRANRSLENETTISHVPY